MAKQIREDTSTNKEIDGIFKPKKKKKAKGVKHNIHKIVTTKQINAICLSVSYNFHFGKVWHCSYWLIYASLSLSLSLSDYTMTTAIDQHLYQYWKDGDHGAHLILLCLFFLKKF